MRNGGFTLLELSVVLVLIAVVLGGGWVTLNGYLQASRYNFTVARMDMIEKTLLDYSVANSRIPCPSDLLLTAGNANYGIEAANPGTCLSGTPAATFKSASGMVEGGVPTRTLRLPDDYLYDGWGRRLRYAVDPIYTTSSSPLPVATSCSLSPTPDASAITVKDATGASRSATAAYVLISHGMNGHGGYTSSGAITNGGSTNANELANCHCNSAGATTAAGGVQTSNAATYVQMAPTSNPASFLDSFDDIVAYKDAWQLQSTNTTLKAGSCGYVYVADTRNNRIQVYDLNGNYVRTIGSGLLSLSGEIPYFAFDSGGILYVTDPNNSDTGAVKKFSAADGAYLGNAIGNVYSNGGVATGIAIDSGNNIWVSFHYSNVVQKFTSAGTFITQIGCGAGPTPCSAGSGNTQLNTPWGIAVDKNDNLYVADSGNVAIKKYNSNGAYISKLTPSDSPSDVYVDSSGYIWVDTGETVEKYDSGYTLKQTVGSYGEGDLQYAYSYGFAIDGSGNFWIGSQYSNYVQKVDSTGSSMLFQLGCAHGHCSSGSTNTMFNEPTGIAVH